MELCPPIYLSVVAIEKGAFGSASTEALNFALLYYTYSYIILLFSTPELSDDLLLDFLWQQVSSSLRQFSQYSVRSW